MSERGTLNDGEPHPMAVIAADYIRSIPITDLHVHLEALSSCAIEGNRVGEVCGETLRRFLYHEPVSDRYLLGLAWYLKGGQEAANG